MKFTLDHYSLAELTQLIKAAERRLKELTQRRPAARVRRELTHFAATHGYTIEQLVSGATQEPAPSKRRKRKLPKVAILRCDLGKLSLSPLGWSGLLRGTADKLLDRIAMRCSEVG